MFNSIRNNITFLLSFISLTFICAQGFQPPASTANQRLGSAEIKSKLTEKSLINHIPFTNVGPTVMSGRVVDVAVNPKDPTIFYVAYASGGLWKTVNNGTSFDPIFDNQAVMTIGDIDIHWESGTIYVGTGEVNSSRSSYAGLGLYISKDEGKTWLNMGLNDTHHIGKVIVSQDNSQEIFVAALGHLYSDNTERGVFKSTDGGKSWTKTLFIDSKTGVVDLERDPADPNILYAASWQRDRKAWNFNEAGLGSGIFKSIDNGSSWDKLTIENSGFPTGKNIGRIGLSLYNYDGEERIYALLDNYNRRPALEENDGKLSKEELRVMDPEEFDGTSDALITEYLTDNRFSREFSAKKLKALVKSGEILPSAIVEYTEDANSLLFDTPVIAAEVYLSTDGGKTWSRTHQDYIESLYNSYGYYFGMIEVSPSDPDKVYIAGVPILKSEDGGKIWSNINKSNVHVDHHSLWINPNKKGHLINGNDGGINISYDDGENWIKCNSPAVGQFYYVNVDMEENYNIYGGAQDNGVWYGPNDYRSGTRWHGTGEYPYKSVVGGDGMQVQIDERDNKTIYAGLQFGNYFRINRNSRERKFITPKHEMGQRPYRWNWQAPILLSSHNQDVLYMGSNLLHRSMNQGDDFTTISEDLTNGGRKGDVAFGTLTCISESPFTFGLIYTGSDDGQINLTRDGGYSWNKISSKLPQDMWVSRLVASQHKSSRLYASLNGYRWDDFTPYLYVSDEHGENWKRIGKDLPNEAINVVKEDPKNENIIYVGTDHGLYVSFDMGQSFNTMSSGLPAVPIHDLVIHPVADEIIIGTHGRSFYKASVSELQLLNDVKTKKVHLFALNPVDKSSRWGSKPSLFNPNPRPEYEFAIYSKETAKIKIEVSNQNGTLRSFSIEVPKGISYQNYDLTVAANSISKLKSDDVEPKQGENGNYYLEKGSYTIKVKSGSSQSEQKLDVK